MTSVDTLFTSFRFEVILDLDLPAPGLTSPLCDAAFAECDGLEITMEPKTIQAGGVNDRQIHLVGPVKFAQLTLKRGMTTNLQLWTWFALAAQTGQRRTASGKITLWDASGTPTVEFTLTGCRPVKMRAPSLNAKDGLLAVEELALVYEQLTIGAPGGGAGFGITSGSGAAAVAGAAISVSGVISWTTTATATATLQEWNPGSGGSGEQVQGVDAVDLTVDFNPQSLELSYAATGSASEQAPGSTVSAKLWNKAPEQQTGQTTTLSMTLIFDESETDKSVQAKTDQLAKLTLPSKTQPASGPTTRRVVRFSWGSFLFVGSVQSMTATIDYFSSNGTPKRASVHLSLQEVGVPLPQGNAGGSGGGTPPAAPFGANAATAGSALSLQSTASGSPAPIGTAPLTLSQAGDTVQGIMGRSGTSLSWQAVAAANNIDNPRLLPAGSVLDLRAGVSPG